MTINRRQFLAAGDFRFDQAIPTAPHQDDDNLRRKEVVTEDFAWAGQMYEDMYG